MRVVLQRVSQASVSVNKEIVGSINHGLLIFVGIVEADTENDIEWLANKIVGLRIFNDAECKMNLSLKDVNGEILLISQFTLSASTKKGFRPSFIYAAPPQIAIPIYERFIIKLEEYLGKSIAKGIFGADMKISLTNDGPVTIIIDSKNKE
ncbi:MAG: D-tyrosyl-tRNA(Tyr) deacylase [Bacteroidetes bacterium GWE2_29_8]|nr:MAG: D-tyrosyl-tRNA(Tyr) deacylase [Bacteroidetes bacterium GWE2_29_8]OFY21043.1 MAG: D-tyrosyl-tRNA(Tyr) deacylase [Bacteroidetes bacterium GWF2_29_10]